MCFTFINPFNPFVKTFKMLSTVFSTQWVNVHCHSHYHHQPWQHYELYYRSLSTLPNFVLHWNTSVQKFFISLLGLTVYRSNVYINLSTHSAKWSLIPDSGMDFKKQKAIDCLYGSYAFKSLQMANSKAVRNWRAKSLDSLTHTMLEVIQINLSSYT